MKRANCNTFKSFILSAILLPLPVLGAELFVESFDWGVGGGIVGTEFDAIGGGSWQVLGGYDNQVYLSGESGAGNGWLEMRNGDQGSLMIALNPAAGEINWQIRNLDTDSVFSGVYLVPAGTALPELNQLHVQKTGARAQLRVNNVEWLTGPATNVMRTSAPQPVEEPTRFTEEKPPLRIPVKIAEEAPRPNIILVLLDDMGYSDLGFIGGDINTPTIDRLANEGVVFTQMLNASKCEPTRASLMSGLYWQNSGAGIQRGITLAHTLGSAGYRTMMTGKWDINGAPVNRGFDDALWMEAGAGNYFRPHALYLGLDEWAYPEDGTFYITDAFTDFGIRFIEENHADDPDRPFFLYLAHYAPHAPLHPLREDWERYRGRFDAGWDVLYANRIANMRRSGFLPADVPVPGRPDIIPAWDSLSDAVKAYETRRMELYAGMFDSVDRGLQRIIDRLQELGKADNTLILILSDNGASPYDRLGVPRRTSTPPPYDADFRSETGVGWAWLSNTPFSWFKRNQHMGGIATPLVAWWPDGIETPRRLIRDPVHIIDIMPTLNALAGADYSPFEGIPSPDYRPARRDNRYWAFLEPGLPVPPLDGRDVSGYFRNEPVALAEAHYFHLFDHRSILSPPWKLSSVDGGNWELYRYPEDKAETDDLAMEYPEEVRRLESQWQAWFAITAFEERDVRRAGPLIRYVEPTTGREFNPETQTFEDP